MKPATTLAKLARDGLDNRGYACGGIVTYATTALTMPIHPTTITHHPQMTTDQHDAQGGMADHNNTGVVR